MILMKGAQLVSTDWLGRQDSNLGSRDQSPLPYLLATPHPDRSSLTGPPPRWAPAQ